MLHMQHLNAIIDIGLNIYSPKLIEFVNNCADFLQHRQIYPPTITPLISHNTTCSK